MGWGLVIATLWVIMDQATKAWAVEALKVGSLEGLGPVVTFRYVENRGAAFGILEGNQFFFLVITVVALVLLFTALWRLRRENRALLVALGLVLGGAVGNAIDRLRLGYVVDFIQVDLVDFFQFPVFNVADIGVTVGVALLIVFTLWSERKEG